MIASVHYISEVQPRGGVPLYQLKITLKRSQPPIWRRIVVRGNTTLDRLHHVIQIVMGWTDSHLHQFMVGSGFARTFYGRPDPEFADMGCEMLNEKRYTVGDLAPAAKRKFIYEYDFGDGWQHEDYGGRPQIRRRARHRRRRGVEKGHGREVEGIRGEGRGGLRESVTPGVQLCEPQLV